ncbi:MAG: phosphotransferase, partial [Nannocystaceae bacterium]|nr:phosphotransferase [Nannocystaceae bacterium]
MSRPIVALRLERLSTQVQRVYLSYDEPCRRLDGKNPETVVVKWAGSDDLAWARETGLYAQLGTHPSIAAPRSAVVAGYDGAIAGLVLCDVRTKAADYLDGRSLRLGVDRLARMHADFWQASVSVGDPPGSGQLDSLGNALRHRDWVDEVATSSTVDRSVLWEAAEHLDATPQLPTTIPTTLVHGDPTQGNVLPSSSSVHLIDWGSVRNGAGVLDLALLIGGVASPVDGWHHEWELVLRYHANLVRGGVQGYPLDACWRDYELAKPEALRAMIDA